MTTAADPVQCPASGCTVDPRPSRYLLWGECPTCGQWVRFVAHSSPRGPEYVAHNEDSGYPSLGDALARHYDGGSAA